MFTVLTIFPKHPAASRTSHLNSVSATSLGAIILMFALVLLLLPTCLKSIIPLVLTNAPFNKV